MNNVGKNSEYLDTELAFTNLQKNERNDKLFTSFSCSVYHSK